MAWNEEDNDETFDLHPEGPDAADLSEEPAVMQCPYCRRETLEDAVRCPYCGNYISREDSPAKREWWWAVAASLLVLWLLAFFLRH